MQKAHTDRRLLNTPGILVLFVEHKRIVLHIHQSILNWYMFCSDTSLHEKETEFILSYLSEKETEFILRNLSETETEFILVSFSQKEADFIF